jgi:DNA polymerase III epsilon subunit-like protein
MRYSTDIVVIDLEASSPPDRPNSVERSNIIEIGAVRLDRRSLREVDAFCELVRPTEYPISPLIEQMTGITPAMVADKDDFGRVGTRFFAWYGPRNKAQLAAFGAYYDVPLLRRECAAHGLEFQKHIAGGALDLRAVATVWLAERERRTSGLTLEAILEKMGIPAPARHHRAADDARAAAAVLQVYHLGHLPG